MNDRPAVSLDALSRMHWRAMTEEDLPAVGRLADAIHRDFPESAAVFAERLRLYPAGCLVLGDGQELHGYALSHPWHFGQPPALDTLLGALPDVADTYYLHDVALAETVRGGGFGRQIVAKLIAAGEAARAPNLTLVAVNDSVQFWRRQGFTVLQEGWMAAKLASYGEDARFMCRPLAGE